MRIKIPTAASCRVFLSCLLSHPAKSEQAPGVFNSIEAIKKGKQASLGPTAIAIIAISVLALVVALLVWMEFRGSGIGAIEKIKSLLTNFGK